MMDDWEKARLEFIAARRAAGTPEGEAFAKALETMDAQDAAARIGGMFALCTDEDLAVQLCEDLLISRAAADRIAAEIRRGRP
jgi:hypothetical protein